MKHTLYAFTINYLEADLSSDRQAREALKYNYRLISTQASAAFKSRLLRKIYKKVILNSLDDGNKVICN